MGALIISHYIYLTKEERYSLHEGKPIETIGVNVPVWFEKGSTSEPAKEIFCKYVIENQTKDKTIKLLKHGYYLNLPQKTEEEKKFFLLQQNTSEKLLDVPDGGSEYLEYKHMGSIMRNNKEMLVIHFIELKPIEVLESTLS